MAKINQYPAKTVPSNNDEFVLHDPSSGSTKKMTRGDLIGGAPLPANSVNGQAIADGSVTPAKRSGGFYSAAISLSAGTGVKNITGFGFRPKEVQFIMRSESGATALTCIGGAVDNSGTIFQYVTATGAAGASANTVSSNAACMVVVAASGTAVYRSEFVSFNSDGISINVTIDGAAYRNWTVIARG